MKTVTAGKQVHVGIEASKTNQTSLSICIDEQGTQLWSLQSLTHKRLPISAMFSNKFHSITPYRPSIAHTVHMQFLHTVKTDHICHAQYSNYIAATYNITHSPCTSKCTTHPTTTTHPTAFHNPSLHTTNKHKAYLCQRL